MNKKLVVLTLCLIAGTLEGCATARTKYSDKNMRVMIDPESIDYQQQVALQTELSKSDRFTVVDRNAGFRAIKQEQEQAFRTDADRYAAREKLAHYGELYSAGTVIVAHIQCKETTRWWNNQVYYEECHEYLSMVDSNTGEVLVAVDNKVSGDRGEVLSWEDTVAALGEKYPHYFEEHTLHKRLIEYKDATEKLSQAGAQ